MNTMQLQGKWNELKGHVKERWGQLTDDDLKITGGNFDQVLGRIQQKTGQSREDLEKFLDDALSGATGAAGQAAQAVNRFAQGAGERIRDNMESISDHASEGFDKTARMIRSRPGQSMLTVLGLGIGVGILVGLSLRSR